MVVAEFESWTKVVRIKFLWPNLNPGEINGHGRI